MYSYLSDPDATLDIESLSMSLNVSLSPRLSRVPPVQLTGTKTANARIVTGIKIFKLHTSAKIR